MEGHQELDLWLCSFVSFDVLLCSFTCVDICILYCIKMYYIQYIELNIYIYIYIHDICGNQITLTLDFYLPVCGLWHYGPQDPITDAKILGSKLLVFFVETNPIYPGWWFGTWLL